MSFPQEAELVARLALVHPEERARLLAFRETFLVRLGPEPLQSGLRNLGLLFGLLVEQASASAGAPGWPAGLRACGRPARICAPRRHSSSIRPGISR